MIRESDLFPPLIEERSKSGWSSYFEVQLSPDDAEKHGTGKARPDAVFTRDGKLLAVEGKILFSWALLIQAKRWIPMADGVAIVIPAAKATDERREQIAVCREYYGFGLFEVDGQGAVEILKPRWHKRDTDVLAATLSPEDQRARPGTQSGERITRQKTTYEALARFVAENPLCTLEDAIAAIDHHYRNVNVAFEILSRAIAHGEVPGVKRSWRQRLEATGGVP